MQKGSNGNCHQYAPNGRRLSYLLTLGIIAAVAAVVILSSVPPVSRDALTHHLAVPKLWINQGKIFEIPSIPFSYYPMNLDLLYVIPLYLGNDIAPKYIHFTFALLTAGLIFNYLKRRMNVQSGLLGALFFLTIPVVVKLSVTAYVDLGLIFFSTATLLCLFKWMEKDFNIKYLIISGVFCGLGLGTKYNGLISLFIMACFVPLFYLRIQGEGTNRMDGDKRIGISIQIKALRHSMLFVAVSLAVFSPWMVKNIIWTGNPVYPLYKSVFSKHTQPPEKAVNQTSQGRGESRAAKRQEKKRLDQNHFVIRKHVYRETWLQTLSIPVRIFFEGQDNYPQYFDGKLNPFLLILPFFAYALRNIWNRRLKLEFDMLLGFSIVYLLFVFLMADMRIRWVSPIIPPLILLSIAGLNGLHQLIAKHLFKGNKRHANWMVFTVVIAMLGMNTHYLIQQFVIIKPFSYICGNVSRDEYIQAYKPEYDTIKYANENLGADDTVLTVFMGKRTYYSDVKMIMEDMAFLSPFKNRHTPDSIARYFLDKGYTHVLLRYDLFEIWVESSFLDHEKALVESFFNQKTNLLTQKDGYGLYRIVAP